MLPYSNSFKDSETQLSLFCVRRFSAGESAGDTRGVPQGCRDADGDVTEEPRWIFHGLPENKVEKSTETFLYTIKMSYICSITN